MGVQLSKFSHQIIFIVIMPLLSAGIALMVNFSLQEHIIMPWILIIDSFGAFGVYTILFQLFNLTIWQLFPRGLFGIVNVPNLNGSWKGVLNSSYDNNSTRFITRVEIIQTFSEIRVFAYFAESYSYSIVANFYEEKDGRQVLNYIYRNEPNSKASSTMHGHYGAGKHEFNKKDIMECSYYNEPPRNRGWYGTFNVKRRKRSLSRTLFPTLIAVNHKATPEV